jgi:hypothetical protein
VPARERDATASGSRTVLVTGGDADPNLAAPLISLERRGVAHESLLVNGVGVRPRAVFIRNDVFTGLASRRPEPFQRALAWYTTIHGWAVAHPEVRITNRVSAHSVTNKPHALCLAREVGLDIPSTVVSNDFELLSRELEARPCADDENASLVECGLDLGFELCRLFTPRLTFPYPSTSSPRKAFARTG